HLEVADLPACAADALRTRLAALPLLARELATAQALALRAGFGLADYRALAPASGAAELEAALQALRSQRVIEAGDGVYSLSESGRKVLCETLTPEEARRAHRALADACQNSEKPTLHLVHYAWHGGERHAAVELLLSELETLGDALELEPELFAAA